MNNHHSNVPVSSSSSSTADDSHDNGARQPNQQRGLFLPSRVFSYEQQRQQQPQQDHTPFHHHPHHPPMGVRWDRQPVMDWIASLVHTTEQRQGGAPIQIGNVAWSDLPQRDGGEVPALVVEPFFSAKQLYPNMKALPRYWDLSYVVSADPYVDSNPAGHFLSHLYYWAVQYENSLYHHVGSSPSSADNKYWADYQTVQRRLHFLFGRVFGQFPRGTSTAAGEMRLALNDLYTETIQQLHKLLDHETSSVTAGSNNIQSNTKRDEQPTDSSVAGSVNCISISTSNTSVSSSTTNSPVPKKDTARYLSDWLRDNWTNPYPDDQGVAEMAETCGTTCAVISNWLINARTRKWRPAIVKATELNRPADLLLEDSLNLYDGHPLRPLLLDNNVDGDDDNGPNGVDWISSSEYDSSFVSKHIEEGNYKKRPSN